MTTAFLSECSHDSLYEKDGMNYCELCCEELGPSLSMDVWYNDTHHGRPDRVSIVFPPKVRFGPPELRRDWAAVSAMASRMGSRLKPESPEDTPSLIHDREFMQLVGARPENGWERGLVADAARAYTQQIVADGRYRRGQNKLLLMAECIFREYEKRDIGPCMDIIRDAFGIVSRRGEARTESTVLGYVKSFEGRVAAGGVPEALLMADAYDDCDTDFFPNGPISGHTNLMLAAAILTMASADSAQVAEVTGISESSIAGCLDLWKDIVGASDLAYDVLRGKASCARLGE